MIQIRPVSDLRNNYPQIEKLVKENETVYLTKNGYGSMVILSLEKYEKLLENKDYIDSKLLEAENELKNNPKGLTFNEVFDELEEEFNAE